jgi:drug/metabolite transporter (DMT)-like permease
VFGTAWGAIFLDEPVTAGMLAGLLLILGSVVLVNEVRWPVRRRVAVDARCAGD